MKTLLVVACGLSVGAAAQQPKAPVWGFQDLTWSPDGKFLTFSGILENRYRIYKIAAKRGSNPVPLAETGGNQIGSTWSPDGKKIAFGSSEKGAHTIYVTDAEGRGLAKLVENGFTPSWSPDGRHIAFAGKRNGTSQICVVDSDGSHERILTSNAAPSFNPSWSPDGK